MSIGSLLPPSLDLPPHLSAQKYFMVCTLTIAAWDTLVLSPRTWRLMKSEGWPALKILFHFLRFFMPIEFTIVGTFSIQNFVLLRQLMCYFPPLSPLAVAFFDINFTQAVIIHQTIFSQYLSNSLIRFSNARSSSSSNRSAQLSSWQ
jgi:hypothetical protein